MGGGGEGGHGKNERVKEEAVKYIKGIKRAGGGRGPKQGQRSFTAVSVMKVGLCMVWAWSGIGGGDNVD